MENLTSTEIKPIGLKKNVLLQELEKELLLYDLTRDKIFCLNETSLMVWNLCDGENSVADIRRQLSVQLKTNITEEMIWLALDKLKSEQLLSNHQEFTINFNRLSRRPISSCLSVFNFLHLPGFDLYSVRRSGSASKSLCCRKLQRRWSKLSMCWSVFLRSN